MCAHFESVKDPKRLKSRFNVSPPEQTKADVWPTYPAAFIRLSQPVNSPNHQGSEFVQRSEAMIGSFGLIPHWSKDSKIARHTYNARTETLADKPAFRDAWRLGRLCIIPAEAIYEPDWRSGQAISTRITRQDQEPMGIAGNWTGWRNEAGQILRSFSMLTINADEHPFMKNFHKPDEEKRMVVILQESHYNDWLNSTGSDCMRYLRPFPAERLTSDSPHK